MALHGDDFESPVSARSVAELPKRTSLQSNLGGLSDLLAKAALRFRGDHKAVAAMDEAAEASRLRAAQRGEIAYKAMTSGVDWLNKQPRDKRLEAAQGLSRVLQPILGPGFDMSRFISDSPSGFSVMDFDAGPSGRQLLGQFFSGAQDFDDLMKVWNSPAYQDAKKRLNFTDATRELPGRLLAFRSTPEGQTFMRAWQALPEQERTLEALVGTIQDPRILPPWMVGAIQQNEGLQRKLGIVSPDRLKRLELNRAGGDFVGKVMEAVGEGQPLDQAIEFYSAVYPGTDEKIIEQVRKLDPKAMAETKGQLTSARQMSEYTATFTELLGKGDDAKKAHATALASALGGGVRADVSEFTTADRSRLFSIGTSAKLLGTDVQKAAGLVNEKTVGVLGRLRATAIPQIMGMIEGSAPFVPEEFRTLALRALEGVFPEEDVTQATELLSTIDGMIRNVARLKAVSGDDRYAKYEHELATFRADVMRGNVATAETKLSALLGDVNQTIGLYNDMLNVGKLEEIEAFPSLEFPTRKKPAAEAKPAEEKVETLTLPDGTVVTIKPRK